jgi:N-acetylglucosaminyldiphosphoundecaprenol N-acetyl-beta-D-mannosaminyltransferase
MRCLDTVVVGGIATARATRAELAAQMAYDCRCARTGALTIDADGMPLVMATRVLCKRPLKERVSNHRLHSQRCRGGGT